jgi:hypothetical protein
MPAGVVITNREARQFHKMPSDSPAAGYGVPTKRPPAAATFR